MKTKQIFLTAAIVTIGFVSSTAQAPFAGNGTYGYSGDGGPATSAQLAAVSGISGDASGNIYISDLGNSDVRKVNTARIISTYAGNQTPGFAGDGGAATSASMQNNSHIGMDAAGNLYIVDGGGSRIRKVTASTGVISTIAGTGTSGNTGNGGAATTAQINANSIAVDTTGNVYFADFTNKVVRKISTTGTISVYAGNGTPGYSGDGGAATAAQLNFMNSTLFNGFGNRLTLDAAGNLYISDDMNNVVRKVNTAGIISTYAGNGTNAHGGDGGPATSASIKGLGPIAMNPSGELFLSAQSVSGKVILRRVDGTGKINTDRDSSWFTALTTAGFGPSFNMFYIDVNNALYFDIWGLCGIGSAPGTIYKMQLDTCQAEFSVATSCTTATFTNLTSVITPTASAVWSFGDGATSTDPNPVHTYSASGTYWVCLTVIDLACANPSLNKCDSVTVNCPDSISVPAEVPAISPNGDGKNDETLIVLTGNIIEIYNRNGILVRTLEGLKTWDGKDNSGSIVPMGYYVAISKETNTSTGITVVR